jgi:RNA polymerase sigma factor (TIGR02999 family)
MAAEFDEVTALLERARQGLPDAKDELIELLYDDFRRRAHGRLQHERPGHSTTTTDLTHEALCKLRNNGEIAQAKDRNELFMKFHRVMVQILIDHARRPHRKQESKRVPLDDLVASADRRIERDLLPGIDSLAVHEALERLAREHPRKDEVLRLRFFSGLTMPEIAERLGVSLATVERDRADGLSRLRDDFSRESPR